MKIRLRLRLLTTPRILWTWITSSNPIRPWRDDPAFRQLIERVSSHTLVSPLRLFMLYQLSRQCRTLEGGAAEIGVYRGGTARLLAESFSGSGKSLHLFDTFEGIPAADPSKDWHRAEDFSDTSLAAVQTYLAGLEGIHLYQGIFPETAKPIIDSEFCFVHIDVDIYDSVLDACRFFYPRMVRSGIVVFDDYGFLTCPGAKAAVDEFFANRPETPCYLPSGQCFVIKQ